MSTFSAAGQIRRHRRFIRASLTTLAISIALLAFLATPPLLLTISMRFSQEELVEMGQLGAAYGGLSALLSGAATVAVAAALILQIRQIKTSQAQGIRMIQIELMSMLVQDPTLRPVSPTLGDISTEQRRRDIYTNLVFRYLQMGFEIGYFPAESLRAELRSQFALEDIRRFWERTRPIQVGSISNSAQRRFMQLVDDAHARAKAEADAHRPAAAVEGRPGPPRSSTAPAEIDRSVSPRQTSPRQTLCHATAGVVLGVAIHHLWRRRRSR